MPDRAKNTGLGIYEQLEGLLQQQHDALLGDDFAAVEDNGAEIMRIAAGLSDEQKKQLACDMGTIQEMHERMIQLLSAKKQVVSAELAATRCKRKLNSSYGAHHE